MGIQMLLSLHVFVVIWHVFSYSSSHVYAGSFCSCQALGMTDSPWFSSPAYFLSSLVSLSVYFAPHLPDCPDFFHLCWTGTASVVVLPVCCCCHRLQCYQWSDCSVWEPAWTVSRFSFYYLDVLSKHCTCTPNVSFLNTHPHTPTKPEDQLHCSPCW